MERDKFIETLSSAVITDRRKNYGPPERNFEIIAQLWDIYTVNRGCGGQGMNGLAPHDVAVMMILMKVARLVETPSHADSWIDIAGYAVCGAEIAVKE